MNDNIYSSPTSDLSRDEIIKGNPGKAIIVGFIISIVGSIVGATIVSVLFGIYWAANGVDPETLEIMLQTAPSILIAYLSSGVLFSVWSGNYVAKKTNFNEYKYCALMIVISTLLGIAMIAVMPDVYADQPLWYTIVGFICYPPAVLFGCWVHMKTKI